MISYEELVENCRIAREDIDKNRWLVGDTALFVETAYGEHTLEDFAREIGANQSTVKGWKRVAKFYPNSIRAELIQSNPNLSYTYFKDALRLETLEAAIEWLADVSSMGYSADEASRRLTEKLGRKRQESAEGEITGVYIWDGDTVNIDIVVKDAEWIKAGVQVTIRAK